MARNISIEQAENKFSEIITRTAYSGDRFIIKRRGEPIAAIVSIDDLKKLNLADSNEKKGTLLAAAGAWSEFKNLDTIVANIYHLREKAYDRKIELQ